MANRVFPIDSNTGFEPEMQLIRNNFKTYLLEHHRSVRALAGGVDVRLERLQNVVDVHVLHGKIE